jgi:DNA (cytosine-5)-methyltransferase 1
VVKSLVAADAETRTEILERMELGAQIDTKDVAAIRRRLAAAKLTAAEALMSIISSSKTLMMIRSSMSDRARR